MRRGRQVAAHAIGDAAVTAYVDGYERALRKIGSSQDELRFRIEHGQLIRQDDLPRIKALGMVVSAQPNAAADPEKDLALIGAERLLHAYPYRSILDAGIPLAFGSDYPGEATYDPMFGIHLAVNRDGPERISVDEAIAAYTTGSAYAEFAEDRKGRLSPGYLADMAILSADPASVPPERIREIGVEATIIGGRTVWSSDE